MQNDIQDAIFSEPAEAFAGVAYAAAVADRELKDIELWYMQALFSRMRLFKGWTGARFKALFEKFQGILAQHGLEELLTMSIQRLRPELYQPVFAVAIDLILADGIVRDEEEEFISRLQQQLQINSHLALQITRVITIKNQC